MSDTVFDDSLLMFFLFGAKGSRRSNIGDGFVGDTGRFRQLHLSLSRELPKQRTEQGSTGDDGRYHQSRECGQRGRYVVE